MGTLRLSTSTRQVATPTSTFTKGMRSILLQNIRKLSFFHFRYFPDGHYEKLLQAKKIWDPDNIFNHCHSVGSTSENCCPK